MNMFAQQHATWIKGPSFPSHNPEATARHCDEFCDLKGDTNPSAFMRRTQVPMNRRMTKPANIVFISGMPLCLA
jgi:hypothetical protein